MKSAHVGTSRHTMTESMLHEKMIHTSPDYFNEALRILDNDTQIIPQREHLTALWGLVIGLSRRLTEASVVARRNRNRRRREENQESPLTALLIQEEQ